MTKHRTYTELVKIASFEERFDYLKLSGSVGFETFGFDRYLNQNFYRSSKWKSIRNFVIVRDYGCDLGVDGYEIHSQILVHHMNPIGPRDILNGEEWITDPEYLITTTHDTHNAIHYGDRNLLVRHPQPRAPGDTKLW